MSKNDLTSRDKEVIEQLQTLEENLKYAKDNLDESVAIAAAYTFATAKFIKAALEAGKEPEDITAEEWLAYQQDILAAADSLGL